jgi:hypothetical protein
MAHGLPLAISSCATEMPHGLPLVAGTWAVVQGRRVVPPTTTIINILIKKKSPSIYIKKIL